MLHLKSQTVPWKRSTFFQIQRIFQSIFRFFSEWLWARFWGTQGHSTDTLFDINGKVPGGNEFSSPLFLLNGRRYWI
jgi:hypothetical protein